MTKEIRDRIEHDVENLYAEYLCANNCSGDIPPLDSAMFNYAIDTLAEILTRMLGRNKL